MAGVPSVRRARGSAIALVFLLAAAPGAVAAADGSIVLAEDSLASMVADVDGDAAREVIAIRRHPENRSDLVVEAWTAADGSWSSLGSTRIERWDEETARPQPARFGPEGVGLLVMRDGHRERAALATVTGDAESMRGCCLSISWLALGEAGLSADLVEGTFGSAEQLQVVDVEGDGVDELLVSRTIGFEPQGQSITEYALLRQAGGGFEIERVVLPDSGNLYLAVAGESDGVPGDDLLFVDVEGTRLVRIADVEGELRAEISETDALGIGLGRGWVVGAMEGFTAMVDETGLATMRWPRGGLPQLNAGLETISSPNVLLLGEGPTARWLELGGLDPAAPEALSIRIYDLGLRLERELPQAELSNRLWEMATAGSGPIGQSGRYLWEAAWTIPGGLGPDRPAFLGHGRLVEIEPDGHLSVRTAARLVGVGVLGVAGAGAEWLAVSGEWGASGEYAYLGNFGYEPASGMLGVLPLADLVDLGTEDRPVVEFEGAMLSEVGESEQLYTSADAFQVTATGQPGDVVVAMAERQATTAEISGTGEVTLTVQTPGRRNANREFELTVFVIGRTGITTGISWPATALRVAPEVTATADVEPFSFTATISGQLDGLGTVTVDGRDVTPLPSGRFRVEVDAPAWPREVLVEVRDPLGNATTQRLEVIGFVDYRGLPWIPIVGTLTVVAGLVLFVRTPRLRPEERLLPDGDGRLEEIDGDLV